MILAWVICGLILAGVIARINQSNKLFWILFTSFMVGIAGSSIYNKCRAAQCKATSSSYCHTLQTYNSMVNIGQVTIDDCTQPSITPTAAGNGELEFNDEVEALSKCCVETRKQPPRTSKLKKECLNILTRPEFQEYS